jgi:hypothetical protein
MKIWSIKVLKMCKVLGCKKNHKVHYCRVCQTNDVSHLPFDCPQGTILYHGTK